MEKKTCTDCIFGVLKDEGYSNYTVENTIFHCLHNAHPEGVFDQWYGEDSRLEFAASCERYAAGKCIELDVELEDVPYISDENAFNLSVVQNYSCDPRRDALFAIWWARNDT